MKRGQTGTATIHVSAPPNVVYDLVSDITRMGEWSPECRSCEWVGGANGPVVGARFRGRNRHGLARWSNTPRVVTAEAGVEFAFDATDPLGRDTTRWKYRFEAVGDGTALTETFEVLRDLPLLIRLSDRLVMGVKDRQADLEHNMRVTLDRIKTAAERPA